MADLLDPAHPGTEDVVDVSLRIFKRSNCLRADHAAVCNDTEPANVEPIPNPLDDGNQRDDIRRIARPHLTAHGLAMVINDSANDHLVQIGTTVLTVALFSEGLTPNALKGDGGRIEEDKIKSGEQITTFEKQCFFNKVLGTPRRKGCGISLVCCHLTQEGHGSIEMMQAQPIHTFYGVVTVPLVTRPVRARDKESMKDGKENRPLDIEAKLPFRRKTTDHVLDPELFPQPPEDERRPDRSRTCCHLTPARQDQQHLLRVAGERADERLDLSLCLETVHAANGADDPLDDSGSFSSGFDDLQVLVAPRFLDAGEHGSLLLRTFPKYRLKTHQSSEKLLFCGTTYLGILQTAPSNFKRLRGK